MTTPVMLSFGDVKALLLRVSPVDQVSELKQLAAKKFGTSRSVTLLALDVHFEEWLVVDDDYIVEDKAKLKVVVLIELGQVMSEPEVRAS